MKKEIIVSGKKMTMVANALVPRIYRNNFGGDIITDMQELMEAYRDAFKDGKTIPPKMLTIFENIAWIFLKQGGEDVGESPEEWLSNLDGMFSVYEVLPQVLELWQMNNHSTSTPKKK